MDCHRYVAKIEYSASDGFILSQFQIFSGIRGHPLLCFNGTLDLNSKGMLPVGNRIHFKAMIITEKCQIGFPYLLLRYS